MPLCPLWTIAQMASLSYKVNEKLAKKSIKLHLQFIKIKMHVFVSLENIRRLIEQIVQKLREQQRSSLVLLLGHLGFVVKFKVVLL